MLITKRGVTGWEEAKATLARNGRNKVWRRAKRHWRQDDWRLDVCRYKSIRRQTPWHRHERTEELSDFGVDGGHFGRE